MRVLGAMQRRVCVWARASPVVLITLAVCPAAALAQSEPIAKQPIEDTVRHRLARFDVAEAAAMLTRLGRVSSTYRSTERNRAVGGAPNSYHLVGRAIDIARWPHVKHADLHSTLAAAGFEIIESLDEGDHSHFAFGLPVASDRSRVVRSRGEARAVEASDAQERPKATLLADSVAGTLHVSTGTLKSEP
jgi:hypothetical protein